MNNKDNNVIPLFSQGSAKKISRLPSARVSKLIKSIEEREKEIRKEKYEERRAYYIKELARIRAEKERLLSDKW